MPIRKLLSHVRQQRGIHIVPYRGYGTALQLYLKGRVLRDPGIIRFAETDRHWHNLRKTYRRFESDEVAGARIQARFGEVQQEVTADQEGYFEVTLKQIAPLTSTEELWHTVHLSLLHPRSHLSAVQSAGFVLVPPPDARFGVISDLDDTVIQSNATNWWRMAYRVLFGNALTRLPFQGVATFYRALQHGLPAGVFNPLFYVSSGPWNLYDLLMDFFELQRIPIGPLFLRDWGLRENELPTRHREHKLLIVRKILETYTHLPFILIGDSGQVDPEIYSEVVGLYPNRILAVYIRSVIRSERRIAAIKQLAEKVASAGSTLILADSTLAAAEHAARMGWIDSSSTAAIKEEKEM